MRFRLADQLTWEAGSAKLTERSAAADRPAVRKGKPHPRLIHGTQLEGFGLAVSAAGANSFQVMRRVNGRQIKYAFARLGEITVAEARAKAMQHVARMAEGVNPVDERRKARAEEKRTQVRYAVALSTPAFACLR